MSSPSDLLSTSAPSSSATLSPETQIISLFNKHENQNNYSREHEDFNLLGAGLLNGPYMVDFHEMALSILLWMAISYAVLYIGAALVALLMMRRHPYVILVCIPMLVMCLLGPVTVGAISSMSLAFVLSASDKVVSPWHCMVLGVTQSVLVVGVSFSRLLGTL